MTALNGTIQGIGTGANRIVKKTGTEIKLSVYDNLDRVIVFSEAGETSQETTTGKNLYDISQQTTNPGLTNTYLIINLTANTNYTFSYDVAQNGVYIQWNDSGTWREITLAYNTTKISFNTGEHTTVRLNTYSAGGNLPTKFQLELGQTATAYEPYTGGYASPNPDYPQNIVGIGVRQLDGTYSVSIDYDDGDERTGTITASGLAYPLYEGDVLDFVNGKVIRANGVIALGDLAWDYNNTAYSYGFFYLPNAITNKAPNTFVKSNYFINRGNPRDRLANNELGFYNLSNSINKICIRCDSITSLSDWNTWTANNDSVIVYNLATPVDEYITLTGDISDIGTATVTADGTLTVKYDKVEMAIRKYSSPPDWNKLDYSATPSEVMSAFDYAKYIKDNWTYTSGTIPKYTNDKRLFFFPSVNVDESLGYNAMFENSNLLHIEPITIGQGTPGGVVNCQTMFKGTLIEEIEISAKTSTQHFNTNNMFSGCLNLKEAEINLISENPQAMFIGCKSLERVTGSLDTSTATNFSTMFEDCSSLLISPPDLDLTAATNLYRIFHNCTSLETIEAWIFSNVTNFQQAFWNCSSLKNLPLMALTAATNLSSMFQETGSNLTEQSRDNLLRSLTSATSYTGTKTLAQLGFTSSMYTAASWQALTHYSDFTTAGWSIGYS